MGEKAPVLRLVLRLSKAPPGSTAAARATLRARCEIIVVVPAALIRIIVIPRAVIIITVISIAIITRTIIRVIPATSGSI